MKKTLITLTLLSGLAMPLVAATKSKAKAAPTVSAPRGAPNMLFIIADDLNDWVGWLGGHPQTRTPNMDRLAKAGMRFTNAHCSYALCNPSRTSLMTGMLPSSSGVFGNEQDWRRSIRIPAGAAMPEYFKASGFTTAAGGKIFHANHGGPEGKLTGWHGGRRGFECDAAWTQRFPEPGVQIADLPVHTGRNFNGLDIWHWDWGAIPAEDAQTDDGQTVTWAANFLAQKQTRPFFLAVGLYRPHSPWYVPQKYFDLFPADQITLPEVKPDDLDDVPEFARNHLKGENYHAKIVDKGLWKDAVRAYLANIAFCDAMLGQLLDALAASPHAGDTVVVFTSDHGWYLGEKQMWHKGKLWEETTHVPLTILAPGVTKEDSVSAQPVSLLDLYPTLCELARVKPPAHLDGESLVPILRDPSLVRDVPVITTMGGGARAGYAARTERWRYIRYADGSDELYDHSTDPNEWTNLAAKPEHAELKQTLAAAFPRDWQSAHRTLAEMQPVASPDGSTDFTLQAGDELSAQESPKLQDHGVYLDLAFQYRADVDADSTLISHGNARLGYALHLVAGVPTFTIFHEGKKTVVALATLEDGTHLLRASVDTDGVATLAIPGETEMSSRLPFKGGFPSEPSPGLAVAASFGPLSNKEYPNSTPFDGAITRARLTVFPRLSDKSAAVPVAIPVDEGGR